MQNTSNLKTEYLPEPLPLGKSRAADGTQYFGEAAVDIIAVQGLGSSYDWTWSREIPGSKQRYHWLRSSIPRDFEHARVLAFDYDSKWIGDVDSVSLQECGSRLLRAVIEDRCHIGNFRMCLERSRRPIIFIGHSFGGLVIKQSIVLASQTGPNDPLYDDHQSFLLAVTSIFFLGTPHRGSSFPDLAKLKIYAARLSGTQTNERLLQVLRLNSDLLFYLQAEFDNVQKKQKESPICLYCYSEQKPVKFGPFSFGFVVSESSAFLNGATNQSMETNHMGLNKFAPEDTNYDNTLKLGLRVEYEKAAQTCNSRFQSRQYGTDKASPEIQRLNQFLRPITDSQKIQRDFKYHEQQRINATPPTCSWIENLNVFMEWKTAKDFKCLWIHGKPGSGKSVLSSYVCKLLQPEDAGLSQDCRHCQKPLNDKDCDIRVNKNSPTVAYFMCGVDTAVESSSVVLGTLLHQVLLQHDMNSRLHSIALSAMRKLGVGGNPRELAALLVELLNVVGRAYVIIDGLEENKTSHELLETIALLSSGSSIRLLILSRKVHDLEKYLRRLFPTMSDFDIIAHSQADIRTVAQARTEELILNKPDLALKRLPIERFLATNANGIFLWLNAAYKHLNDRCSNPNDVERSLRGLHPDMNQMYQATFDALGQSKTLVYERKRIQKVLMWLCVSAISMSPSEISTLSCLEGDHDTITLKQIEDAPISKSQAAEELKILMGSIVEILDDRNNGVKVRLYHPTLKEFLTHEDRTNEGWPFFSQSRAHKYCASVAMSICQVSCLRLARRSRLTGQPSILDYAWQFWHWHFHRSGLDLSDAEMARFFDRMLASVFRDSLSVLEGLAEYLSQQFDPGRVDADERLSFVRAFQNAQEALALLLGHLAVVCGELPLSKDLQSFRREFDEQAEVSKTTFGMFPPVAPAVSKALALFEKRWKRSSPVQVLQIDALLPAALIRPKTLVDRLIDLTRAMRVVVITVAISPVYQKVVDASENMDFTPMTFLVQVCNMFETTASFPYWNQQPSSVDPLHAFNIYDKRHSKEYGAGAIVRRHFSATERWKIGDARLRYPRPQHNMVEYSAVQWNTALIGYRLFFASRDNHLAQTFALNPMAQTHARHSLFSRRISGLRFLENPMMTLMRHVPEEVRDAPVRSFLTSIPSLLWLTLAHYVKTFAEAFGGMVWPWLEFQWLRIKLSREHLDSFLFWVRRTNHPESTITYIHWTLGLVLYFVRRRYFLWLGAHSSPHPIEDIISALTMPERFLEDSLSRDWKWWVKYNLTLHTGNAIFSECCAHTRRPANDIAAFLPTIMVTFWMLCVLERAFCAAVNATATLLMFITLVFQDKEVLLPLIGASVQYWFRVSLVFSIQGLITGSATEISNWAFIAAVFSYLVLRVFPDAYGDAFWATVGQLVYPMCLRIWAVVHGVTLVWLPAMRIIGIFTALLVIVAGLAAFSSFIDDPLGLEDSRWRVQKSLNRARNVPGNRERFQIKETPNSIAIKSPVQFSQTGEGVALTRNAGMPQPE